MCGDTFHFQSRVALKTALLSPLCLALVKQRSSCEQLKKEEALLIRSCLGEIKEDRTDVAITTATGNQPGLDTADLESLERWFFYGLILCQDVVDVTKKESGEYRVWAMLLQGMWVAPVIRES